MSESRPTKPLTTRLREATADAHERIENSIRLFTPAPTIERYAALLGRWYGFEKTWQHAAPAALDAVTPAGFVIARRKLHLLRADLLACGLTDATIDALPAVPNDALPWHEPAAALGVLYVVEGSTLGGQYVAKSLHTALGLTPEHGVAYFSSYGPDVGVRWRETKRVLDEVRAADSDRVIAGANATFEFLIGWLGSR